MTEWQRTNSSKNVHKAYFLKSTNNTKALQTYTRLLLNGRCNILAFFGRTNCTRHLKLKSLVDFWILSANTSEGVHVFVDSGTSKLDLQVHTVFCFQQIIYNFLSCIEAWSCLKFIYSHKEQKLLSDMCHKDISLSVIKYPAGTLNTVGNICLPPDGAGVTSHSWVFCTCVRYILTFSSHLLEINQRGSHGKHTVNNIHEKINQAFKTLSYWAK